MSKKLISRMLLNQPQHWIKMAGITLIGATLTAPLIAIAAFNSSLDGWQFFPQNQQLKFFLSAPSQPNVFLLRQPPRLVVDLPNTKLGMVPTQQEYASSGIVQRIRLSQLNATDTRIVMDLAPGTSLNPQQVQVQQVSSTQWVISPLASAYGYQSPSQLLQPQPIPNYPSNNQGAVNPYQVPYNYPPGVYPPLPNGVSPQINPNYPTGIVPPVSPINPNYPNTNNNNSNQTPPMVVVPPIAPINSNPNQLPTNTNPLPPAMFPNQTGNWNNLPLIPQNPSLYPQTPPNQMMEWGQELPPASQ